MTERLPDFAGIGALKAGTTFLDGLLRSHPQLSLPKHLKETEYFTRFYERGPAWYASQFNRTATGLRGEVSPQYLADADCIERIRAANPDVRLVVSLRNPVDRVYSQYRHWVQETGYPRDFASFVDDHPGAVRGSCYATLLEPWFDAFPRSSFSVIVFEDLVQDPVRTVQGVYAFLGVDPTHIPDTRGAVSNASMTPRHPTTYRLAKRVSRGLYAHGLASVVGATKSLGVGRLLRRPGTVDRVPAQPPESVRDLLVDRFRADAAQLVELTRPDLLTTWELTSAR